MRIGCENTRFRFLAAAYGRINSTWTLPNQVGWPIAKELLFSARIVEAEEAYRIGLLNHLVPSAQLREKTMELARMIAGNRSDAVMGIKDLLLRQMGRSLEEQWVWNATIRGMWYEVPRPRRPFPSLSLAKVGR